MRGTLLTRLDIVLASIAVQVLAWHALEVDVLVARETGQAGTGATEGGASRFDTFGASCALELIVVVLFEVARGTVACRVLHLLAVLGVQHARVPHQVVAGVQGRRVVVQALQRLAYCAQPRIREQGCAEVAGSIDSQVVRIRAFCALEGSTTGSATQAACCSSEGVIGAGNTGRT